jgi:molybdenum cofactor biosynthesis protein B
MDALTAMGFLIKENDFYHNSDAAEKFLVKGKDKNVNVIITTGGTGLSPTDVTIEAVRDLLEKELTGFNALFTQLSYAQVKSAAILSRAIAGSIDGKILFCLPGSPRACELAMNSIILPELGHIFHMLWEK